MLGTSLGYIRFFSSNILQHYLESFSSMSIQFSLESIEYLAEKLNNCQSLSHESLSYLTLQVSELISNLLQDACKVLRKCRRKDLTADDFAFALKLHDLEPMYGGYTTSNNHHLFFRRMKKDNRILYHIDDNIVSLDDLMICRAKIPLDISIRTHWLAVNGKQPMVNENPIIETPLRTISGKKFNKRSHILSTEQQIYYKELTELCISSNESKRKQALSILSSDNSLQQIIAHLIIFISEGVRINLTSKSIIILKYLIEMIEALLKNEILFIEPYLHDLLPAILSCLLENRISREHWLLRDLAAKCCGQIIRKYSTAANGLQQRVIDIFYRILNTTDVEYTWGTQYGAFIGLCEMNHKVIIQIVFPLIKQFGEKIRMISDVETSKKLTETVVKFITTVHHSIETSKSLDEIFGSYFGPLIQQQLILLL